MDIWDKAKRSEVMGKVKGHDTKPELLVRKFLFSQGLRYRLNVKRLPGKPDIVLPKYKTVIFIHGCFWHGHETDGRIPKSNVEFWKSKIEKNKIRDKQEQDELKKMGWKVIIIWECELSTKSKREVNLPKLLHEIISPETSFP